MLVLILFKNFRNRFYREFIEDVDDIERVQEILHPQKYLISKRSRNFSVG